MSYNPEELAQTLFEESGDALFLFDPETEQLLDANPTAQRLSGFPRRDILRQPITYWFRSEQAGGLQRLRHAYKKTGVFHSQEGFLLRHQREGVWIPVNLTITRLHAEPKTLGLITARDISERRQAQARLEKAEAELRQVLGSVSDYLWSADIDARGKVAYRYYSPVVERITGRPPEFYVPGPERWLSTVHPDDRPRLEAVLQRIRGGQTQGEEEEYRVVRPDGSVRWVRDSVTVARLPDGQTCRLAGVGTDVTERRQAEAQRRLLLQLTLAIAEANDVASALAVGLRDVCALTGWALGQVWVPNAAGDRLECSPSYHGAAAAVEGFRARSAAGSFARGEGLPGRVWAARRSEWVKDVARDPNCSRADAAAAAGLKAAMGIPILAGDEVLAVLEFFMHQSRGEDEQLLDLVSAVAAQLGNVLHRKRVEQELAHEQGLLRTLMENVPVLIYFKDAESRYLRVNQAEADNLGVADAREAVGKTDFDYYPAELAREFYDDEQRILRSGQPLVDKMERQTGVDATERWLVSTKVPIVRDGRVTGIVGVSQDVTEHKRAERALQASEEKYRSLVENLEQSIFLKDEELRFVAVNRHFCDGVDEPEAEILGKTDHDLYPPHLAEKYRADDLVVLLEGKRLELEEQNLVRGNLRTVRVIKTPVRDDEGRVVGVLGIFWDVTEHRVLEAQLRQAQKMEAIGQLAGGVAHDFNNLLTAILGNISLVLTGLPGDDANRELLVAAEKAALRAAELTSQLLGFSRRTLLRLVALNLNHTIDETVGLLRRTIDPRVVLETRCAPDLWTVQADPSQMNQILMNLCLNARDAMPEGGRIVLETANCAIDEAYARLHLESRPGEFVRLRVSDTGHGMPPEVKARIFEPFFTTKGPGKGTGLGLAMVFGIVQQHRGWIDCSSEVGRGTRFDLYLPRFTPHAETAPAAAEAHSPLCGRETVLLADDEPLLRNLGRTILQHFGYRVLLAEDGEQAVELYHQHQEHIDLVILDLTMPRLSGRDALRRILALNAQVRVLLASGYSADHVHAEHERIAGFVGKPYRPEELARAVRTALDRPARYANGHVKAGPATA